MNSCWSFVCVEFWSSISTLKLLTIICEQRVEFKYLSKLIVEWLTWWKCKQNSICSFEDKAVLQLYLDKFESFSFAKVEDGRNGFFANNT